VSSLSRIFNIIKLNKEQRAGNSMHTYEMKEVFNWTALMGKNHKRIWHSGRKQYPRYERDFT
jgi:hypothetical protein